MKGRKYMKIRLAKAENVPEICVLYNNFFIYNASQQPDYYKSATETGRYPESVIKNGSEDIFVAEECDSIIGLLHIKEEETPPYDCFVKHRYASVIDLFVLESYRGTGTGGLLIKAAEDWSAERGLDYIELNVLAENEKAIGFYKHEGFEEVSYIMRRRI
jgi:GNAT superfamily N-acetyltransferase